MAGKKVNNFETGYVPIIFKLLLSLAAAKMYKDVAKRHYDKENIVDPDLEKIDPTPSIYDLFRQFNQRFFWDKLNMVEVSWSGRQMTTCAGVCSFHPRTGYCNIRLSAPLLSLRPRKDLVETLLHEMIHAFLFMTHNNKDRNDHGPEFHKHMYRINQAAGTNITVYHTFSDEVRHFKTHVWRCTGPCQKVGPFFGFVRRANNRAPGPNDRWWEAHRLSCSGNFEKIEEPPGYKSKTKKGEKAVRKKGSSSDLRNFFPSVSSSPGHSNIHTLGAGAGSSRGVGGGMLRNKGAGTVVVTGKTSGVPNSTPVRGSTSTTSTPQPRTFVPSRVPPSGPNIHTISDLSGTSSKIGGIQKSKVPGAAVMTGESSSSSYPVSGPVGTSKTRFPSKTGGSSNGKTQGANVNDHVRNVWANKFPENPTPTTQHPPAKRKSEEYHVGAGKRTMTECSHCGDLICESAVAAHGEECPAKKLPCPVCGIPVKNGCLEQHLSDCLSDSITEDVFGSDEVPDLDCETENREVCPVEKFPCPVCGTPIKHGCLEQHLNECLSDNITEDIFGTEQVPDARTQLTAPECHSSEQHVACPICGENTLERKINFHIDECLSMQVLREGL